MLANFAFLRAPVQLQQSHGAAGELAPNLALQAVSRGARAAQPGEREHRDRGLLVNQASACLATCVFMGETRYSSEQMRGLLADFLAQGCDVPEATKRIVWMRGMELLFERSDLAKMLIQRASEPPPRLEIDVADVGMRWLPALNGAGLDRPKGSYVDSPPFSLHGLHNLHMRLYPRGNDKARAGYFSLMLFAPYKQKISCSMTACGKTSHLTQDFTKGAGRGWSSFAKIPSDLFANGEISVAIHDKDEEFDEI